MCTVLQYIETKAIVQKDELSYSLNYYDDDDDDDDEFFLRYGWPTKDVYPCF